MGAKARSAWYVVLVSGSGESHHEVVRMPASQA
jgi:hypothetical protein